MHVVIAGGGVIGAATAFFLAERGHRVTIVERHAIAGAASGKAGGFLALDWCDGTALGPLARRSFALHAELAERFNNPWDYRRLDTFAATASARRSLGGRGHGLTWLAAEAVVEERLGTTATTAQVHPAAFTRGLVERSGARVVHAVVTGLTIDEGAVRAVETDAGALTCDAVVLTMGPWTALARAWLPLPPIHGLKGASIVLDNPSELPPHAVFAQVETAAGGMQGPEIFTRPDGTTYVCGVGDKQSLPADPAVVAPEPNAEASLRAILEPLAPALAATPALVVQACYRPVTRDSLPIIGAVGDIDGAFVATGHGVWGILNAPATGEAMAALIGAARPPIDLRPFAPGRGAH